MILISKNNCFKKSDKLNNSKVIFSFQNLLRKKIHRKIIIFIFGFIIENIKENKI